MKLEKITRDFIKTLTEPQKKRTTAYDSKGIVTRIEDGIAWVKLAGSKIETPLQMTISADPGDEVQARIGNGTGWLTGNGTAPPTDDRLAKRSYKVAKGAAEKADELEDFANIHFMKTEHGLYITADKSDWKLLVSNNGVYIIDKNGEATSVYSTNVVVGKEGGAHQVLAEDSAEWYANENTLAGGIYYGESSRSYADLYDSGVVEGQSYGYVHTDFEEPVKNETPVSVTVSGELFGGSSYEEIDGQLVEVPNEDSGTYSIEAEFELDDLTSYRDYYYQQFSVTAELSGGGSKTFYFTFIVNADECITRVYYGFKSYTPGTVHTMDVIEFSYSFHAVTGRIIIGEKVFFGEAESGSDDVIAKATSIFNCLRLGHYSEVDWDGLYAMIVGNGTDDDNRNTCFAISKDGYMKRPHYVDVPDLTEDISGGVGLDSSDSDGLWLGALVGLICWMYPGRKQTVFEGILRPNSQGFYRIYIYDTDDVSESSQPWNRMPRYCHGEFIKWSNNITRLFTNNYSLTARSTTW